MMTQMSQFNKKKMLPPGNVRDNFAIQFEGFATDSV